MRESTTARTTVGYGAGPVSIQLTRGRPLTQAPVEPGSAPVVMAPPTPARDRHAHDRLALKHWPRGHRVLVCSLTGGTGRTTIAALLAATLAGLPFAHLWPPALLVAPTHTTAVWMTPPIRTRHRRGSRSWSPTASAGQPGVVGGCGER